MYLLTYYLLAYIHTYLLTYLLIIYLLTYIHTYIHIYLLTHSLTLSLTLSLTHSLTHLLTYLLSYLLTSWSKVLLGKLRDFHIVKKFPAFYKHMYKCPPTLPILSRIRPIITPTSHFLKIHRIIILPSTPWANNWVLSFRFSNQKLVYACSLPHTPYIQRSSLFSIFYNPNIIW